MIGQEPASLRLLMDSLAGALETTLHTGRYDGEEAAAFLHNAAGAMRASRLHPNLEAPAGTQAYPGWSALLSLAREQHEAALIDALAAVTHDIDWIDGQHFWPGERYRYFAEKMYGALLVGDEQCSFLCDDGYILLLHTIEPHSVYPLHQHSIPEGYYVVAGNNEWSHDGENWQCLPPGSLYYNASWQPHTIRTGDEPSLSLDIYLPPFGWDGGLCEERGIHWDV